MTSRPPARRAFTLVETLAASALAGLLLLTVMSVISSLGREHRLAQSRSRAQIPPDLVDLLRHDATHATDIKTDSAGRITLTGYSSLHPDTLAPTAHLPVQVTYHIRAAANRPWLTRRQQQQGGTAATEELVCAGVTALQLVPVPRTPKRPPATRRASTHPATAPVADQPTAPESVRLRVTWDDPTRPPIDRILTLR